MPVLPGVYMLRNVGPSSAYVVRTDEGLLLIDAGLDEDAASIKAEMTSLGLDWRNVRAVFLTHAHADHTGGANHLREQTGAAVYAGQADASVLEAGSPREAIATAFMPEYTPHPTVIDSSLVGGEVFAFDQVRVRALSAPGHTAGSLCYLVERDGKQVLFGGDVVMRLDADSSPRYDLPGRPIGTYTAYLPPRYGGDAKAFLATLDRLRGMRPPDIVLPGHPDAPPDQNPRMAPDRWVALLDSAAAELKTLIARRSRDGIHFLDGVPQALLPDLFYLGDFRAAAVYAFFADSRLYLVDAPGGSGLSTFVRTALRRLGRDPVDPAFVLLTSVDSVATAGLSDLLKTGGTGVVVGSEGLERIRSAVGRDRTVLEARQAAVTGRVPIEVHQLSGRGNAPVAYVLRRSGKVVLFSGRIPIRISKQTVDELMRDVLTGDAGVEGYIAALDTLERLQPDLWLPLVPLNGQDANLYDGRWELILQDNREGLLRALGH